MTDRSTLARRAGEAPANAVDRLAAELSSAAGIPVELERPNDPEHGDYATNAALQSGPARKRPPRDLAEELAAAAVALPHVERADVAGPGFVNLVLRPSWFAEALEEIGPEYSGGSAVKRERVQVEMVSANPTGPLMVHTARNAAYGDSVARLLDFAGHAVEREYYFNDSNTQIDRFRASVEAARRGDSPPEDGYQGAYIADLARLDGDPVPAMMDAIRATLTRFRVRFDTWQRESEIEAEVPQALEALDTYEADGAVWARTSAYGDDKDRVVVRSAGKGGRPTYAATDAAYIRRKFERGFGRIIYVLGADHHGYVGRLKALAAMLGHDPDALEVLLYQLVSLTRGGEARKASKRRGEVVPLDEFMDEIGVDAARWYLVSRGHDQAIEIDVDLARERSEKNPVYYVQYAHARTSGILRNAGDRPTSGDPPEQLAAEERDLIKRLAEFPGLVAEATERRAPHALPTYAIRLADDFHRFYHHHRVLESDAEAFRLALVGATQTILARSLDLVGVEAPERM